MIILDFKYILTVAVTLLMGFVSCKEDKGITNYYHRVTPVISLSASLDGANSDFFAVEETLKTNEVRINFPYYFPENSEVQTDVSKRSEEHTSELQSRENLVCRLLLEKKKMKINAI